MTQHSALAVAQHGEHSAPGGHHSGLREARAAQAPQLPATEWTRARPRRRNMVDRGESWLADPPCKQMIPIDHAGNRLVMSMLSTMHSFASTS